MLNYKYAKYYRLQLLYDVIDPDPKLQSNDILDHPKCPYCLVMVVRRILRDIGSIINHQYSQVNTVHGI